MQSELGILFLRTLLYRTVIHNTLRTSAIHERISVEIDGYSDDPRNLWQIPQVAAFFHQLRKAFPSLPFWLGKDAWPVFFRCVAAGLPSDEREQIIVLSNAVDRTLSRLNLAPACGEASDDALLCEWLLLESIHNVKSLLEHGCPGQEHLIARVVSQSELSRALGRG